MENLARLDDKIDEAIDEVFANDPNLMLVSAMQGLD